MNDYVENFPKTDRISHFFRRKNVFRQQKFAGKPVIARRFVEITVLFPSFYVEIMVLRDLQKTFPHFFGS